MLKKDFLYEARIVFIIILIVNCFFFLLSFVIGSNSAIFYQIVYQLSLMIMSVYPIYVFKRIAPKRGEFFNAHQITSSLPLSIKDLFWKGLKPWLIISPFYFILLTAFMAFLRTQAINSEFFNQLCSELAIVLAMIIIFVSLTMQLLSAQIIYLTTQNDWIQALAIFMAALVAIPGIFLMVNIFNLDKTNINLFYIILGIYLAVSMIVFLKNFKNIEKIHQ